MHSALIDQDTGGRSGLSLVVAEATASGARIVSDTRLLYPSRPSAYKTGTLKTVVLHRDVTVGFAGDVGLGLGTIRGIASDLQHGGTFDDVLSTVKYRTATDPDSVEFIVAVEGKDWQLARIRQGHVEQGLSSAWIGDREAFERFQRARHAPDPLQAFVEAKVGPGPSALLRLGNAMQAVIEDPTVDTVDHFCVRVALQPDGFQYLSSFFIYVGRDIQVQAGDDLINRMAQSVQEGGYTVSIVEPAEPGTPALGLSFPRAMIGMIFVPLVYDDAQVLHDVSPNDFASVVRERFGVMFKDPPLRH